MAGMVIPGPAWISAFLAELMQSRLVGRAIMAAGVSPGSIYAQKRRNQLFADAWSAALSGELAEVPKSAGQLTVVAAQNGGWQAGFLEKLAETSNISASALAENVPLSTVYRMRSRNPAFAAKWRAALVEGYINLEMELLGYLRDPAPGHKMDVANALRLLSAHKDTISQEQAVRSNVSAAEVRESIARKVEKVRQQVLADRGTKGADHSE